MKACTKCGVSKDLDQFYRQKQQKDGLQPWCKTCVKTAAKARYAKNGYPNRTTDYRKPQSVVIKESKRQSLINRWGIDVVEVLDELDKPQSYV